MIGKLPFPVHRTQNIFDRLSKSTCGSTYWVSAFAIGINGPLVRNRRQSILALSWLRRDPYKLLAGSSFSYPCTCSRSLQCEFSHLMVSPCTRTTGSSAGSAVLYNVHPRAVRSVSIDPRRCSYCLVILLLFTIFVICHVAQDKPISVRHDYGNIIEELTSIHCNCDDRFMVASGYTKDVQIFDIATGQVSRVYKQIHEDHINISRFANHLPNILLTCSFDNTLKMWDTRDHYQVPIYSLQSEAGNVMVCFSPNDQYFLASAIDNEVKQYCTVDGRLDLSYNIKPVGSNINYTRSYYGNDGQIIISGYRSLIHFRNRVCTFCTP